MKGKTINDVLEKCFIEGYSYGHNDTVEGSYGSYEEKAKEYNDDSKTTKQIKEIIVGKLEGLKKKKIVTIHDDLHNDLIDQVIELVRGIE